MGVKVNLDIIKVADDEISTLVVDDEFSTRLV